MAPFSNPSKNRKHGQVPLRRRNEVNLAVQHAAAIRSRRDAVQDVHYSSLRPELEAISIPGLLENQGRRSDLWGGIGLAQGPIPGLQLQLQDVQMDEAPSSAVSLSIGETYASPMSHLTHRTTTSDAYYEAVPAQPRTLDVSPPGSSRRQPSTNPQFDEYRTRRTDRPPQIGEDRIVPLFASQQPTSTSVPLAGSSGGRTPTLLSANLPDVHATLGTLRNHSSPGIAPDQLEGEPSTPRMVVPFARSASQGQASTSLDAASMINQANRQSDQQGSSPVSYPSPKEALEGPLTHGGSTFQQAVPRQAPSSHVTRSREAPSAHQTQMPNSLNRHVDDGAHIADSNSEMSDDLYGRGGGLTSDDRRIVDVGDDSAMSNALYEPYSNGIQPMGIVQGSAPPVAAGPRPNPPAGYSGVASMDDVDDDLDMSDEDIYGRPDGDPNQRITTLELQFKLQAKGLTETRNKLSSTERKIDLLCGMVSRLGTASDMNPTSPGTAAVPALVVVGSRSHTIEAGKIMGKRRKREDLLIQKAIDAHWDKLMLTYELPQEAVVKGYKIAHGRACSAKRFQPDHRLFVKSDWNISVVQVFMESLFSANHPDISRSPTPEIQETVERLAFSQLRSWRNSMLKNPIKELERLRAKRRYERRRQSFLRRRNVAAAFADTRRHIDMIKCLGTAGMSSDESDHEQSHGIAKYKIKAKRWRHPDAERCLRVLDALHRHERFQKDNTAGPGARVHLRTEGGADSTRRPKVRLPDCLYNPELLGKPEGERLKAVPSALYDWGHTHNIIQLAKPNNGDASQLDNFPEL